MTFGYSVYFIIIQFTFLAVRIRACCNVRCFQSRLEAIVNGFVLHFACLVVKMFDQKHIFLAQYKRLFFGQLKNFMYCKFDSEKAS